MEAKLSLSRKNKLKIQQSFTVFMIWLVFMSGIFPSIAAVPVIAETSELEEPHISKDVEGIENLEVLKGDSFNYHVKVAIPSDVNGYESMKVIDNLDENLIIESTAVLINGEVDNDLKITVEGQNVSLSLEKEMIGRLAGNELTLQITTQLIEDIPNEAVIENIAEVQVNDELRLETNKVVVTPSVEKEPTSEISSDTETTNNDENIESEPQSSIDTENIDSTEVESQDNNPVLLNEDEEQNGITINDVDTYSLRTGTESYIVQYDGNNPSNGIKGMVQLEEPVITNGLALGKNEDVFYGVRGTNLYKVYTDGSSELVTDLESGSSSAAGAISPDGTKFYYLVIRDGQMYIANIDLTTEEKTSIPIEDNSGFSEMGGGDFAFDGDGNLWFSRWTDDPVSSVLAKVDLENNTLESIIPIVASNGDSFSRAGGLSLTPDGKFLLRGNYTPGSGNNAYVFELDPATGIATEAWRTSYGETDYASRAYPTLSPELLIEKSNDPTGDVYPGDSITYTLTVSNTGNLASTLTTLRDELPDGTSYVLGTTTLNGEEVEDVNGMSPLFTGMLVNSPGESLQGVVYSGEENEAVVSFQVQINNDASPGTSIVNTATVSADNVEAINSNEVENPVIDLPEVDACAAPVALVNGSFEDPPYSPDDSRLYRHTGWFDAPQDAVPGWVTTDNSGLFEIMNKSLGDEIPEGSPYEPLRVTPAHGDQFVELNSRESAQLYQDVDTTPGQTIYWRLAHHGRLGPDTMALKIDSAEVDPQNLNTVREMTSDNSEWHYYSGTYEVPAGQTRTRFAFEAISSFNSTPAAGNFLDDIFLGTEPCVEAVKTVSPEGEVYVGDELTYEITVTNNGGDIAADTVLEDAIPEGTEYVPGSLKITDGPGAGDLTDDADDDAGQFDSENIIVELGDLPNTDILPNGVTVQFKVRTLIDHAGDTVVNKAQVRYQNLLNGTEQEVETNEVENPVLYQEPLLESGKSASIEEKAEGNTDVANPEVGDTIRYTITTRNTVEDSLVENLVIRDTIPSGLTYVLDSLEVNGVSVTDAEDEDAGHVVDGNVTGTFGDITDTETYSVSFLVTVDAGQAGQDIQNVAEVQGDNTEIDEPEEEVKVYPRDPVLESEKSVVNLAAEKETFEVGDTVVYTIQTRNTVTDSLVEDLAISDELPEGLEFVEGSLEVSHDGVADYADGIVTASFGDVEDTEWRTVTFEAVIESGQSGNDITNIATVGGSNTGTPDEPTTTITVDPKDPELESEKTSSIEEKAEGNTDVANPEVGDTIRYTITTRNTVEDSLVENLVIRDTIPSGLTYVADSLEVNGLAVTDVEDDDAGHVVDGNVTGTFGDITDTETYSVSFLVTVDEGQAGQDIQNVAEVQGDNTEIDEPEEEVKVYPRDPVLESEKSVVNLEADKEAFEVGDTVVYTIQTRNTITDSLVEDLVITDELPTGLTFVEGSLEVSYDGVADYADGIVTASFGDVEDTEWRTVTFEAVIESGQSGNDITNIATVGGSNTGTPDEPTTTITVDPKDPELESEKTSSIEEKAEGNTDVANPEVGDTIRYTITTRNTVEDSLVENLVIRDTIPSGLTYVSDSLEVNGVSVTDTEDEDAGHVVDGDVTGTFGDITDTETYSVSFLVTVDEGQAGQDIRNVAEVQGDNTEIDEPEEEVKVYPRDPVLESEKSVVNLDAEKEAFEVGDTVVYTIQTRNTITDSLVEDLVITDELPTGLTFVEDSLEVSHEGEGSFTEGTMTASFGDVEDTEWRTVTFEAVIESGQSGNDITNIATVGGSNTGTPDEPTTTITVDPKDPELESEKTSSIEEKADGNTDVANPEVGDTIRYTITTRNTVEDSLVENLVIRDTIPSGLTYVADSLEVNGVSVTDAEDDDAGHVVDGNVTGTFGDITDTETYSVSFLVTVDEGQAGQDIQNVAEVQGDNTEIDEPEEVVEIYPRNPMLEAEKLVGNLEEGKETFEVGDTVVYTIQARNTVADSLVEDLIISDELPEGLEFVEGSLEVSHNGDAEYADGIITASFGDVRDTEWRTVMFQAVVEADQSGNTITNIPTVSGSNTGDPDRPEALVEVDVLPASPSSPQENIELTEPKVPTEPTETKETIDSEIAEDNQNKLPRTATNSYNIVLIGIGLLLAGIAIMLFYIRRKNLNV